MLDKKEILNFWEKIKWEGYESYNFKDIKYIVDENKVKHNFSEFFLSVLEYMIDYNVSDTHIIVNYMSFMVAERIWWVLFPIEYKKIRVYLLSWLQYKWELLFWKDNKKSVDTFINENIVYYDLFFWKNVWEKWTIKINYDNLWDEYKEIIQKINENKWNIDLTWKKWFIQFLVQINRWTSYITWAKDIENFQSLRYTLYRLEKNWEYKDYDYRLQFAPITDFSWLFSITIRLLATKIFSINNLWYDEYLPIIKNRVWTKKMHLLCWETNSWKSTSIVGIEKYLVDSIRKEWAEYKVIRVEDPIEKKVEWAEQIEVNYYPTNPDEKKTFSDAVRSAMREDPDIIVVWEIRDKDTWDESLSASITWHIVLSTIHINNSFAIFKRMESLKPALGSWWNDWIDEQKILNWLWLVITTDLLTTYKKEDTISLKSLILTKKWDKKDIYTTYYKEIDNPILSEIYNLLNELKSQKKITKSRYPLLSDLHNEFLRFYPFYEHNQYIDKDNKKEFIKDFNKFILYTIANFRIPFGAIQSDRIWRKPVMEVLNINSDLIQQIQLSRKDKNANMYDWLAKNEKVFLPRFYFAYVKNIEIIEQWKTFDFLEIVKLATMWYIFEI